MRWVMNFSDIYGKKRGAADVYATCWEHTVQRKQPASSVKMRNEITEPPWNAMGNCKNQTRHGKVKMRKHENIESKRRKRKETKGNPNGYDRELRTQPELAYLATQRNKNNLQFRKHQ
uniref:Uncharacterized protein n=1 Tax=Haemonchus contortus TaxID=6289 RepID=A0A7I4YX44_HAECO